MLKKNTQNMTQDSRVSACSFLHLLYEMPSKKCVRFGAAMSVQRPAHPGTGPSSVSILQNQDDTDQLRFNWLRPSVSPPPPLSFYLSPSRFSLHRSPPGISLAGLPVKTFLPPGLGIPAASLAAWAE